MAPITMNNTTKTSDLPVKANIGLDARSSYHNEGTAMTIRKRQMLGVQGLSPSGVENVEIQKRRALRLLRSKSSMLEKYLFLAHMRTSNVQLFYKLVLDELEEMAPVIYTPTVGTACLEYSNIYPFLAGPGVPDGLYLTKDTHPNLCEIIKNYQPFGTQQQLGSGGFQPDIAVISDGSRILGLGDLGVNGMGIPIGKLQLYVAAAGIDPRRTLPIILDMGTDNEALRNDEFYLGLHQSRPSDHEFYETVDTVLSALRTVYPGLLIQFEDWSSEHAFKLLEKYQSQMLCFNDDIQGTGAVILSGVMNAIRRVENENNVSPKDHRIVFYGAGSAAIGVARQIQEYFSSEHGMTEQEARRVFWIVDSKGLVTIHRGDTLAAHKVYYARDEQQQPIKSLLDIINHVKPTMLIGLSSTSGAFTNQVLERMAELNKNPIIFPLSNPATQAECTFEEAMQATNHRVIFASGTAFPAFTEPDTGKTHIPGQGNNMYIFPGLGLGAILARPFSISDRMIYMASKALADALTPEEISLGYLYPRLQRIRQVSAVVAAAVCEQALKEGIAQNMINIANKSHEELVEYVSTQMWVPANDAYGTNCD